MYRFIGEQRPRYPTQTLCRVLGVGRSGSYAWLAHKQSPPFANPQQQVMEQVIVSTFQEHRKRYGVRRLEVELREKGCPVSKYKIRQALHHYGLQAIQPRSFVPRTTESRHPYPISPNLLLHREPPQGPNQVWVGDITYVPLAGGGFLYLSEWMDLFSRRVVGWQLDAHLKEALVLEALQKGLRSRVVRPGMIVHSDQGGQYAGGQFRGLLAGRRLLQSMSRRDNVYDNAFMESLFSRLKAELLQGGAFESLKDAQTEISQIH